MHHAGVKGPLVVLEYPGGKGGGMDSNRYREQVLEGVLLEFYEEEEVGSILPARWYTQPHQQSNKEMVRGPQDQIIPTPTISTRSKP
jgi:hypothetical protein